MGLKSVKIILLAGLFIFSACGKESDANDLKDNQVADMLYGPDGKANWDIFKEDLDYLLSQQKYEQILKKIKDYENAFPSNKIDLAFFKAVAYFGKGDLAQAKDLFKQTASHQDYAEQTYYYYGHIARKEGNAQEAEANYLKSYGYTKNPEVLSSLADLYHENKRNDKAMEYYQKAIAANPESYMDRYFLANLYYDKGNLAESERLLKEALEINKGFKKAYLGLYAISKKKGKKDDEIYYYCRALFLDQAYDKVIAFIDKENAVYRNLQTFKFYVISLAKSGLNEKFKQILQEGLKRYPQDPDLETYLGISYAMDKNYKQAISYLKKLTLKYPNDFNVWAAYGDSLFEDKQIKETIFVFEKALMLDPSNTSYRYRLAELYRKNNQIDKEMYHQGVLYIYQQQLTEALEFLTRVQKPDYPDQLYFYLGKIYSEKKNTEEGIKAFQKAIEKNPKMVKAYLELAYLYMQKQNKAQAVKLLSSFPGTNAEIERLKKFLLKM